MANFKYFRANNSQGSKDLFINRSLYRAFAYSPDDLQIFNRRDPAETYPLRDFRVFENFYYGRVDAFLYPVQPQKSRLVNLSSDPEDPKSQFALDFVAHAFLEMKKEIQDAALKNTLPQDNEYIAAMDPVKSFVDINVAYNSFMQNVQELFFKFIREKSENQLARKITSIETFIPVFTGFLKEMATERTLLKGAYLLSSTGGTCNNSGLVVEIASLDKSDDEGKFNFINSQCFCYYVQVASKYGFYVDYNAPWRLIADVTSPPMLKFRKGFGSGTSLPSLFTAYYTPTYITEMEIIQNLYFRTYETLLTRRPWFQIDAWSGQCRYSKQIYRVPIGYEEFLLKYKTGFWLEKYVKIKNWEKRGLLAKPQLERIIQNSQNLEKKVDKLTAIRYINRKFRESVAAAAGSFNAAVYSSQYKNQKNLPFTSFKKFLNELYDFKTGNF